MTMPAALRPFIYYALSIAFGKGLTLFMLPFIAHHLPPVEFARLDMAASVIEPVGLLAGMALAEALFRFGQGGEESHRAMLGKLLGIGFVLAGLLIGITQSLLVPLLLPLPNMPGEMAMRLILLAACLGGMLELPLAFLRLASRAGAFLAFVAARAVTQAALTIAALSLGYGIDAILMGNAAVDIAILLVLLASLPKETDVRFDIALFRQAISYCGPLLLGAIAMFALGACDRWFLAGAVPPEALAHYALAAKLALALALATQPFALWWYPRRLAVLAGAYGAEETARCWAIGVVAMGIGALAVMIGARVLIGGFLPASYGPALILLPALLVGVILNEIASLSNGVAYSRASGWQVLRVNAAGAMIALVLYVALIPELGVSGAIVATLAGQAARVALFMADRYRGSPLPYPIFQAILFLCACFVVILQIARARQPRSCNSGRQQPDCNLHGMADAPAGAFAHCSGRLAVRARFDVGAVKPGRESVIFALSICLLVFAIGIALPIPLATPIVAVGVGILPFAILFAVKNPFALCLGFVVFSFFRIHEVFPVLMPLRIPQLLAIPTLGVLVWHFAGTRAIRPFITIELKLFLIFFLLVTLGVPFATDRPTAIGYWTATYVKIAIMTFAIAWLTREASDFRLAMRALVIAGVLVAIVTMYNKINGIGLVEGTRVTIGRDIRSVLGDPNDLSLVLMFPLSFAVALTLRPSSSLDRLLGGIGILLIVLAVIATQSRGGLLGILAVFGTVGWRIVRNKAMLIGVGGTAAAILFLAAGISSRASGGAGEEGIDESAMGRVHAWGAAIRMATSRPLNGVGLDNFVPNYFFYSDHWDGMNHAVHSTWFGVLGETGFLGLIVFVSMVVMMVVSLIRSLRVLECENAPIALRAGGLGLISGVAGFCASGTFLTQGFTWPIYVLVALSAALSRSANRYEQIKNPKRSLAIS